LQQNAFSENDFSCPLEKTTGMMKAIVRYYEYAHKAIEETAKRPDRINFAFLKTQTATQLTKLKNMKFQNPRVDRKEIVEVFANLVD